MTVTTILRTVSGLLVLVAISTGIGSHSRMASIPRPTSHAVLAHATPGNTIWG